MFFLLRMTFWLSVVLVLLPSGGSKQQTATTQGSEFGAAEAVTAATATFSDMRNFCSRQPDACTVGSQAAVAFGQRAQAGAKMVYDMISERSAPRETGSIADRKPARDKSLHNTLTAADLAPAWRGPRQDARQDAQHKNEKHGS
jgi:Family of unknown function (DUF5330)